MTRGPSIGDVIWALILSIMVWVIVLMALPYH